MHTFLLLLTLLGLSGAGTFSTRLMPAAVPNAAPPGPNIYPAANDSMPTPQPIRGPSLALRPQLEAVLTIQLLSGLTEDGKLHWTAAQRAQLQTLLSPLKQARVTAKDWAAIGAGWETLLTPAQRRELETARAHAEALAERRLSMSRLALLDGPGTEQTKWRYAFALQRGTALVRQLEKTPDHNPYGHSPYREHLDILLKP
ncbi:hypothetical protein GCM10017783_15140 [Deinococcus piscis]|uniref:Uncharacterized protein n=1 Tax=Deinococcus piscis TaxID=394230 RepID=A0ABQ3K4Z8_9DEIO|nr:hypothetical protein [Deinococcus piscis]GHG03610.1 hypothetical protein GCM10017783_15140 [Deinococcus piscis]